MIVVNGMEYRTLGDEFFVNGKKVYEVYANGVKVYPEPLKYDAQCHYLVAEGEGSLSTYFDPDDLRSPLSYVNAKVTWAVRFRCNSVTHSGLSASITGMRPLDDGSYFQVWTIIEVGAGGGGDYNQLQGNEVRNIKLLHVGTSGTYKIKRTDFGGGPRVLDLCNMGDLGYGGQVGSSINPLPWDLSELVGFAIVPSNLSSGTRDVEAFHYNNDTGVVRFNTLELTVGEVYKIETTSVRICYTDDNGRDKYEWVDPRSFFETKYLKRSYYPDGGVVAYSNDGKIVHREGMISGDVVVEPYIFHASLSPGPPRVRPSKMKLYKPGEELPDVVGDVDSIEEYDYRPIPSS